MPFTALNSAKENVDTKARSMKNRICLGYFFLLNMIAMLVCDLVVSVSPLSAQSRISYNNQQVFLSGSNVAWVNFAGDIGPGYTNFDAFQVMFDSLHASGGNSMRFWLHTTGASTPQFNSSGMVVGPGVNTIEDLRTILDMAWQRRVGLLLCLWSFDMLRISNGTTVTDRAKLLLTDTAATRAYLENALLPMVNALKGHPGIIAWEVFNEAEGMSNEHGWDFNYHVPMSVIQRFVNRVTGAIHRADPRAQVTTGAWSFIAQSDIFTLGKRIDVESMTTEEKIRIERSFAARYNAQVSAEKILGRFAVGQNTNYYRDDRLIAAGGDSLGTLDFYTVHYYDWARAVLSPFHYPYSHWNLTKPLAVTEFYITTTFGVPYNELYRVLYRSGYAGAMSWQWYQNSEQQPRTKEVMRDLFLRYGRDIEITPVSGRIYNFSAFPTLIEAGDTSMVTWNTSVGSSVTLNGSPVAPQGTLAATPHSTTTYTLIAIGSIADTSTIKVSVYPTGRIIWFQAKPSVLARGETSLLRWRAVRGSRVNLNGVGVNEVDSLLITPDSTTMYLLAAEGAVRDTAIVKVEIIPPERVNRALGKKVAVSWSEENPQTSDPQLMVDGNLGTYWVSGNFDAQWIILDLGRPYRVQKISIFWGINYAKMYRIGISRDSIAWTLLRSSLNANGGTEVVDSLNASGRYLKFLFDKRAYQGGYAVRELQVFGLQENPTSVDRSAAEAPHDFALFQNYPNPFNPNTVISYQLSAVSFVTLKIYDVLGREIATLVNEVRVQGLHAVTWEAISLPSGVYFYHLQARPISGGQRGDYVETKKMILIE